MNKEFKVGDKVYCPTFGTKVYTLTSNGSDLSEIYPLTLGGESFTEDGKHYSIDNVRCLIHANDDNRLMLEKLYGVEFEKPPIKPTSKEIIEALLERGDTCVPCWVSDDYEPPLPFNVCVLITKSVNDGFRTHAGMLWEYATPFNPRTGEPITELPE